MPVMFSGSRTASPKKAFVRTQTVVKKPPARVAGAKKPVAKKPPVRKVVKKIVKNTYSHRSIHCGEHYLKKMMVLNIRSQHFPMNRKKIYYILSRKMHLY